MSESHGPELPNLRGDGAPSGAGAPTGQSGPYPAPGTSSYGQPAPGHGPQEPAGSGYGQPGSPFPPGQGQPEQGRLRYGQPGYGDRMYQGYGQPGAPGWTPTPRPGIIPLRPLGLGDIFDGAFRAMRANPKVMFGITAIVSAITAVVAGLAQYANLNTILTSFDAEDVSADLRGSVFTIVSEIITVLGTLILTGMLTIAVSRAVIGQKLSTAETWHQCRGQILRLLGVTAVLALGVAAVIAVAVAVGFAAFSATDADASDGGAIVFVIVVLAELALVAGVLVFFGIRFLFATPAVMLERISVPDSLRRSWALTRGRFWRTFGVILLFEILASVAVSVVTFGVAVIAVIAVIAGAGDDDTAVAIGIATAGVIAAFIANLLTLPFIASGQALLYIDARIRSEGLDIELARVAQSTSGPFPGGPVVPAGSSFGGPNGPFPGRPGGPFPGGPGVGG